MAMANKRMVIVRWGFLPLLALVLLANMISSSASSVVGGGEEYVKEGKLEVEREKEKAVPAAAGEEAKEASESWVDWAKEKLSQSIPVKTNYENHDDDASAKAKLTKGAGEYSTKTSLDKAYKVALESKEKAYQRLLEAKEKASNKSDDTAQEAYKNAQEGYEQASKKAEEAKEALEEKADEYLSWAKDKATEGYEAAKNKVGETVGSGKETVASNYEAAKQKSIDTKDNLAPGKGGGIITDAEL